mmetsp:Transcript_19142/g.40255  ORF Transcript_19142/g.40255 Transcript_19142/m.40255 type:complete len:122 (+) Transcript_19142:562-927(+)
MFDQKIIDNCPRSCFFKVPFNFFQNCKIKLKMSHEHQGFIFEPNPKRCVEYLTQHSGGKISTALRMAIEQGQIECPESASSLSSESGEEKGASERSSGVAVVNESEKTKRRWGNIFHWCDC